MALMKWTTALETGNLRIDADHKKLIAMANELADAMHEGKGREILGRLFDDLINYTSTHFKMEEGLMKYYQYPDATAHFKEHTDLVNQVMDLQAQFKAGKITISMTVLEFLKNWLTNHIQKTDAKLGAFIHAH